VESFDIIHLRAGESFAFERVSRKERLFVGKGDCQIVSPVGTNRGTEGSSLELSTQTGIFEIPEVFCDSVLVRICGRWTGPPGEFGVFGLDNSSSPKNTGDPTEYPRRTEFDNHYHDCDEYWIIIEGRCVAISEQKLYVIGPGDCLATGMGHHHDVLEAIEPVRGIYFETTLEGRKRQGHLWNHMHGPAAPKGDRV
jgi:mannose-6-phosphate isomerase-like protein (cupin superfamily)